MAVPMTRRRRGSERAGGVAAERHERGRRSRRRSVRPPLAAAVTPFVIASLVAALVGPPWVQWLAGVMFGAAVSLWVFADESPPPYVEDRRLGAEGERRTAAELAALEAAGWRIVHDVAGRFGNLDHVAVGPTGLFLLETKNPRAGTAEIRDGAAWLRHRHLPEMPKRIVARARVLAAAARLNADLQQRTGCRTWVQAVVVLWCDFPAGVVHDGRCVYVHGTRLRGWLEGRPLRFDPASVAELGAALDAVAAAGVAADGVAVEGAAAGPSRRGRGAVARG
jgi:hypothetical protein